MHLSNCRLSKCLKIVSDFLLRNDSFFVLPELKLNYFHEREHTFCNTTTTYSQVIRNATQLMILLMFSCFCYVYKIETLLFQVCISTWAFSGKVAGR